MAFYSIKRSGAADFATFYEAIPLESKLRPAAACELLGIKPTTLARYLKDFATPPPALVRLLFLESFYGVDAITTKSFNGEMYARAESRSLRDQLAVCAGHLIDLEAENAELRAAVADGGDSRDFAANSNRFAVG